MAPEALQISVTVMTILVFAAIGYSALSNAPSPEVHRRQTIYALVTGGFYASVALCGVWRSLPFLNSHFATVMQAALILFVLAGLALFRAKSRYGFWYGLGEVAVALASLEVLAQNAGSTGFGKWFALVAPTLVIGRGFETLDKNLLPSLARFRPHLYGATKFTKAFYAGLLATVAAVFLVIATYPTVRFVGLDDVEERLAI